MKSIGKKTIIVTTADNKFKTVEFGKIEKSSFQRS